MKSLKLLFMEWKTMLLVVVSSLWAIATAEAAVVAGTGFEPDIYPGDSIPWDLNSVKHYGMSGNTMSSNATYSGDGNNYRVEDDLDYVYCVTKNASTLNKNYMESDDYMCVVQFAGTMTPMTSFFKYKINGLRVGTEFTITMEYVVLNTLQNAKKLFGITYDASPEVSFEATLNPNINGTNTNYKKENGGAATVSSTKYQTKQTVTLTGTVADNEPLELTLLFGYASNTRTAGIAIGITDIKVEGTIDPYIFSSLGTEACQKENTVLTLDKEYNASSYSWLRKTSSGWEEISDKKSCLYEMTQKEVFCCIVDGVRSNELEVDAKECCQINGQPASRKTLLWETFGYFTDPHTYVDKDGNVSTTPASWPWYRADVSYNLPGNVFDDGSGDKASTNAGFTKDGQVNDGLYAIIVPSSTGFYKIDSPYDKVNWYKGIQSDHTSLVTGQSNSGALFVNVDYFFEGLLFEAEFKDICSGVKVFYETWMANHSVGLSDPLVTLRFVDEKGNVLGEDEDGTKYVDYAIKDRAGWQCLSGSFTIKGSVPQNVKMQVFSSCGEKCTSQEYWSKGNDLIIDDIKFMVCSPPSLDAYSDLETLSKDTIICGDIDFTIECPVSNLLNDFYGGDQLYLFQYSKDGGTTWDNVSAMEDVPYFDIQTRNYPDVEEMLFRVVVARAEGLKEFMTNPNLVDFDDNCRGYSVSEPITITRNGDIDLGAPLTSSVCLDDNVVLKTPSFPDDVVSWRWTAEDKSSTLDGKWRDVVDLPSTYLVQQKKHAGSEIFYFEVETANGCSAKRKYIVDEREKVDFEPEKAENCGVTTFSILSSIPADASFTWTFNDEEYQGKIVEIRVDDLSSDEDSPTEKLMFLVASADGYCPNDNNAYSFIVKAIPEEPQATSPSLSEVVSPGEKMDVSNAAQTTDKDYVLEWVAVESKDAVAPSAGWSWSDAAPSVSRDVDSLYMFLVRQKNPTTGCFGDSILVEINISAADDPKVRDTVVCVGSVINPKDLVEKTAEEYSLVWYDTKRNPDAVGDGEPGDVDTDEPAKHTYYVSQMAEKAGLKVESRLVPFTITVVGPEVVDTTGNIYHYCKGDSPVELKAQGDADTREYTTQLYWKLDDGEYSTTKPVIETKKEGDQTYQVSVCQIYKIISSGEECKGESIQLYDIKVVDVEKVKTETVTYLRTDAVNGEFSKNLMEQGTPVTAYDGTLYWYNEDCETAANGEDFTTVPTPVLDLSKPEYDDQGGTYCVKQMRDGCLSEGEKVNYVISSSPKPKENSYVYCADETPEEMTVEISYMPGKENVNYKLKWYGDGEEGSKSIPMTTATPNTSLRTSEKEKGYSIYYYYVTQVEILGDASEGAESSPTTVTVTIYDKPKIEIDESKLEKVCKPATIDISKSVSLSNEVNSATYNTTYYTNSSMDEVLGKTVVAESGNYQVGVELYASAKANDATCASDMTIPVVIDTMRVVVSDVSTCPDMSAEFNVLVETNATEQVSYNWSTNGYYTADEPNNKKSFADPNAASLTSSKFSTKEFKGADYGDKFVYNLSVSAGACSGDNAWNADTMKVTLGNGPVYGHLTIVEDANTEAGDLPDNQKENEFYSCGTGMVITASYTEDAEGKTPITDYEWTDMSGNPVPGANGATLTLPASDVSDDRIYKVSFTNGCSTYVTIIVHNRPLNYSSLSSQTKSLCEGEEFETAIINKDNNDPDKSQIAYQWYCITESGKKNVATGNGVTLKNDKKLLAIDKVEKAQSGRYGVMITRNGCSLDLKVDSLVAMPYIQAVGIEDTVERHTDKSYKIEVAIPSNGAGVVYDWQALSGADESTNPVQLNDIQRDYNYKVYLTADGYCNDTVDVNVIVDAELMLNIALEDTICVGREGTLIIDTIGTGRMVHDNWERGVYVEATTEHGNTSIIRDFVMDANRRLTLNVSPQEKTYYKVVLYYGEKSVEKEDEIVVIEAISVKIPTAKVICEGETSLIQIDHDDVRPTGTFIRWVDDETILHAETLDTTAIEVKPTYKGGVGHQYEYYYDLLAINSFCHDTVTYKASVKVDEPLVGEIKGVDVICENDRVKIDASSYGSYTYSWSLNGEVAGSGAAIYVSPKEDAQYNLSMTRGVCTATDSFSLTVKKNPVIVGMDSLYFNEWSVVLSNMDESPYLYWVDDLVTKKSSDPVFHELGFSQHVANVEDANGCKGSYLFTIEAPAIHIPDYFTPNGDGKNDAWVVAELASVYPNAKVTIFDRFGKMVAVFLGSQAEGWDGTYNGHPLPSTDYWYVIDIEEIDRQFKGHFTLLRQ